MGKETSGPQFQQVQGQKKRPVPMTDNEMNIRTSQILRQSRNEDDPEELRNQIKILKAQVQRMRQNQMIISPTIN